MTKRIEVRDALTGELICWYLERDAAKADRLAQYVTDITISKGQEQ